MGAYDACRLEFFCSFPADPGSYLLGRRLRIQENGCKIPLALYTQVCDPGTSAFVPYLYIQYCDSSDINQTSHVTNKDTKTGI